MIRDIIPTQNVTWDDIRDTLNAGGGSVTNVVSTAFSKSAKINKWSKYKPVRLNQDFPDYATYWKAQDGYCGLVPAKCGADYITDSQKEWVYNLPRGGSSEPYRLGDFRGYNPNALPQYTPIFPTTAYANDSFDVLFSEMGVVNESTLKFKELTDFINDEFYISCVARVPYSSDSSTYQYVYASTEEVSKGGNLSLRINTKGSEFKDGRTVELFLFLSDRKFEGSVPSNAMLYAYPDSDKYERKGSVLLQAKPTFVDRWNITSWNVTEHYNYIDFIAQAQVVSSSETNKPAGGDLRFSYNIQTSYGESWTANRQKFLDGNINVSEMSGGKFTITGRITLPTTVMQTYSGLITIDWTNGVVWDAFGGQNVEWVDGVDPS